MMNDDDDIIIILLLLELKLPSFNYRFGRINPSIVSHEDSGDCGVFRQREEVSWVCVDSRL